MIADLFDYLMPLGLALVAFMAGRSSGRRAAERDMLSGAPGMEGMPRPVARAPMAPGSLDPVLRAEAAAMLAAGEKIDAIRLLREATGLGLKDSKELAEAIEAERGA